MKRKFVIAFHVAGTLSADLNIRFTVPSDCQLVHVSACVSDANAAGLNIGTSTNTSAYLVKFSTGVSGTPVEKAVRTDFVGEQFPRISDGDIVVLVLDYNYNDGGGASASDDPTIILTFLEG